MNIKELALFLRQEGFADTAYSLVGENPNEALCLRSEQGKWCVFYAERGLQSGKVFFSNEEEACEYFLNALTEDPTTRKNWKSGFTFPKGKREQE